MNWKRSCNSASGRLAGGKSTGRLVDWSCSGARPRGMRPSCRALLPPLLLPLHLLLCMLLCCGGIIGNSIIAGTSQIARATSQADASRPVDRCALVHALAVPAGCGTSSGARLWRWRTSAATTVRWSSSSSLSWTSL